MSNNIINNTPILQSLHILRLNYGKSGKKNYNTEDLSKQSNLLHLVGTFKPSHNKKQIFAPHQKGSIKANVALRLRDV